MAESATSAEPATPGDPSNLGDTITLKDLTISTVPEDANTPKAPKDAEDSEDASDSEETKSQAEDRLALSAFKPDGTPDYDARMRAYDNKRAEYIARWEARRLTTPPPPPPDNKIPFPLWLAPPTANYKPRFNHQPPSPRRQMSPALAKFFTPPPSSHISDEAHPALINEWMQTPAGKADTAAFEAEYGTLEEQRDKLEKLTAEIWESWDRKQTAPEFAAYREWSKTCRVDSCAVLRRWHEAEGCDYEKNYSKPNFRLRFPREYQLLLWKKEDEEAAAAAAKAAEEKEAEAEQKKGKTKTGKGKGKK